MLYMKCMKLALGTENQSMFSAASCFSNADYYSNKFDFGLFMKP